MNPPIMVRLRLAVAAFRLKSGYFQYGEVMITNLPHNGYCRWNWPGKDECKTPSYECVGKRQYRLDVSYEPQDEEYCHEHQRVKFGKDFEKDGDAERRRLGMKALEERLR